MNYGEEITYWYLRLNGFFPITNFVVHRSTRVEHSADIDLLAVRPPFVYEEVGGCPRDWDPWLVDYLGLDRFIGVICEVKTGDYDPSKLFRPNYVEYALGRLGFVPREHIQEAFDVLKECPVVELPDGNIVFKLLVTNGEPETDICFALSLNQVEDFIVERVRRYPKEKYADRMFFSSELFQHTIHRVRRERNRRSQTGA